LSENVEARIMAHRENFAVEPVEHEHIPTIPIEKSPIVATEDIPAGLTDAVAVDRSEDNPIEPFDNMASEASPSERGSGQPTKGARKRLRKIEAEGQAKEEELQEELRREEGKQARI
jgi:hypothetical protein